ncbi:hypothetical protein C8D87_11872 [Lentzea atacamensis]|uniref:Methyltransferase domain-containing protein n=1 Tax=Lentzea atacamensis TaxID=531938 RepID=A0ABX9DUW1_9PSEU|nr:hypothetical protein [Lentzea atacamensis]RAS58117.1 hypothetical protein C8D87_11872 [Lentzea atacamensis]
MYDDNAQLVDNTNSLLSGDRVFAGNQPDDFALASALHSQPRVCQLGLGSGGSLRPMVAMNEAVRVTAVEYDESTLSHCVEHFGRHFPKIAFDTVLADAQKFVENAHGRFDVYCVDLYEEDVYPGFVLDRSFWRNLSGLVGTDGFVVVNCWGLPLNLDAWSGRSPQHWIGWLLRQEFAFSKVLWSRRNATIVVGNKPLPSSLGLDGAHGELRKSDRAIQHVLPLRWGLTGALPDDLEPLPEQPVRFDAAFLNDEMVRRWPAFMMTMAEFSPLATEGMPRILTDMSATDELVTALLAENRPEAVYLPGIAASTHFEGKDFMSRWYGDWLVSNWDRLVGTNPEWAISVALWQALCIVACPLVAKPAWSDEVLELALSL